MAVLLYFYRNQTHKMTESQSTRLQKQALQTGVLYFVFHGIYIFYVITLKQAIKNSSSIQSKTQTQNL